MFDRDTMIVTYDSERGEPRGGARVCRRECTQALNLGSCVDCSLCVQVCPTGIDIRNGLQYECIGCSACIDVCDTVMDKMSVRLRADPLFNGECGQKSDGMPLPSASTY